MGRGNRRAPAAEGRLGARIRKAIRRSACQTGWYWSGYCENTNEGEPFTEGPFTTREEAEADLAKGLASPRRDEIADGIAERIGLWPKSSRTKQ
jgi:hypothetical protein